MSKRKPAPPPIPAAEVSVALAAEIGDGVHVPGWWCERSPDTGEITWFMDRAAEPWAVSVYSDKRGEWEWDLDWCPRQEHHRAVRPLPHGAAPTAWQAMRAARAAYRKRPRGKGVPCPACYGWGYWCDHGGGSLHECEPCDNGHDCPTCKGGMRRPGLGPARSRRRAPGVGR